MQRGTAIGLAVLAVLVGIAIGVSAYNAGYANGLEESGAEVVRVVGGPGGWGGGFPFGLLFFPLFFFGIFFMARALFWRRGWGPGPWAHPGPREAFEDWHRRVHEGESAARTDDRSSTV